MTREELLQSPAYWTTELQMELYRQIVSFMEHRHMNKTQLAKYLGCSKGYITQLLNGDFDHKMSKFVELSLAVGKIPEINFKDIDDYILFDKKGYTLQSTSLCEGQVSSDMSDYYILAA